MRKCNKTFIEQLTNPDNLYWAWDKVKKQYHRDGLWYNEIQLAHFEMNLRIELQKIAEDFRNNSYKLELIKPIPFPKKKKDADHKVRQFFDIHVRDQVAWIALLNIIGPNLDYKMPAWSYGSRLYRPVWIEEDDKGKKKKKYSWYRHTSGYIYRKFIHSWPLFRRHISITIKIMSGKDKYMERDNEEIKNSEEDLPDNLRLPYFDKNFWPKKFEDLYWASIDFNKFYPNIKRKPILDNIKRHLKGFNGVDVSQIVEIATSLLGFRLDCKGWSKEELEEMGFPPDFETGIPTGLFASHFLANIAMLTIDEKIDKKINDYDKDKRNIAHFRYVDDHIVIASSFDELVNWIKEYEKILDKSGIGVRYNVDKFTPNKFREYLKGQYKEELKKGAEEETHLDPQFPKPLMTETIAQVSNIARTDFDLLDEDEQIHLLEELKLLMLADFHDDEIREDTRLSFAAMKISKLAPKITEVFKIRHMLEKEKKEEEGWREEQEKKLDSLKKQKKLCDLNDEKEIADKIKEITDKINGIEKNLLHIKNRYEEYEKIQAEGIDDESILRLLMQAVHKYPDKLRLWRRAFEYCKITGVFEERYFKDEMEVFKNDGKLTYPYFSAFVKQVIAQHIIECAKVIVDNEALYQRRVAASSYLEKITPFILKINKIKRKRLRKHYEIFSADLLRCAVGTVELILTDTDTKEFESERRTIVRKMGSLRVEKINWRRPSLYWQQDKVYGLSSWAWWAESMTNGNWESSPGPVWKAVSCMLTAEESNAWPFWIRYPKYLNNQVITHMCKQEEESYYFNRLNCGWIYDVGDNKGKNKIVEKLKGLNIHLPKTNEETISSLYDWILFTQKLESYDPRGSEWTCLFIIEQCIEQINSIVDGANYQLIHPANFSIPSAWSNSEDWITWNCWEKLIKETQISIVHLSQRIGDQRITPEWERDMNHLPQIRGMGMLLLGLLRKSFEWPNIWNPEGLQKAYNNITAKLIKEITCSSRTCGILEACLLWRSKENFNFQMRLFNQDINKIDEDTLNILPKIYNSEIFKKCLQESRNVLKKHQMSVHENMPRQLIPIRLEAVKEEKWFYSD